MVYRYLDAHEVLIEVIGDIEDAKAEGSVHALGPTLRRILRERFDKQRSRSA